MAHKLQFLCLMALFLGLQADWIEITQKTTSSPANRPNSGIRILKKTEVETLLNTGQTTPSPQWVAYQKERFGQQQNTDSHKLVVTTENQMKNSAKVIVPANNGNKMSEMHPKNQIIKTTTRVDVSNNRPMKDLTELSSSDPQTTTKRDMNHAGTVDDYEYVETVENVDEDQNTEYNENAGEEEEEATQLERPSWQGFIKFIKRIQRYWMKHAGFSINDKINYLKRLRDNLMLKIEEQFDLIFPTKDHPRRTERSILGESKINFPPEFSVITINFLTFAVFLIKLTLQVVRLLKSKHYKISGLGLTTINFMKTTTRN